MKLKQGLHLAYCTNIHPAESWQETLAALHTYTLQVRDRVSPHEPFAIGLRLSNRASEELYTPANILSFRRWLAEHDCYVFTINGFPFGQFHGTRVKEQVYRPDWQTEERLEYTIRLFRILSEILPAGVDGSVSTLPGSYKSFITSDKQVSTIRKNLWRCVDVIADLTARTGFNLHLGLEPEPFGLWENTGETMEFFRSMQADRPGNATLNRTLGVNFDTCHFALQFEEATDSLSRIAAAGIRVSKLHLSSALTAIPTLEVRRELRSFEDNVYLHQVIGRKSDRSLQQFEDLPAALACQNAFSEWRIHYHVPLYSQPASGLGNTINNLLQALDWLSQNPAQCSHLEIETYTWEVLPQSLRTANVVEQLTAEYRWLLPQLRQRQLA